MFLDSSLRMIVAGTPRGGTNFIRFALSNLGYTVGHEDIFNDETIRDRARVKTALEQRPVEIEVSGFAAPFCGEARRDEVKIVQLIRSPVSFVNSVLHKWPNSYGSFAVPGKAPGHTRLAQWWLKQHQEIAKHASSIVMLEDINIEFCHILFELGVKIHELDEARIAKALDRPPRERSESGAPMTFTMEDMPPEVQNFAEGFGY